MQFRRAKISDLSALVAFNQAMAAETEDKALDSDILTQGVSAVLHDANKGFYLVADMGSEIVASLMVTFEWSDWRNANFWWIQSVYVLPAFRRQGLYSRLYQFAQSLAATADTQVCGYRLYVEKDNASAQQTYRQLGMHESHYLMFETE